MRLSAFFLFTVFVFSCVDSSQDGELNLGVSIISDSIKIASDTASANPMVELKNNIETLKAELLLDPSNGFLKNQIQELEADLLLIESVNSAIDSRDSIINAVLGLDSL